MKASEILKAIKEGYIVRIAGNFCETAMFFYNKQGYYSESKSLGLLLRKEMTDDRFVEHIAAMQAEGFSVSVIKF